MKTPIIGLLAIFTIILPIGPAFSQETKMLEQTTLTIASKETKSINSPDLFLQRIGIDLTCGTYAAQRISSNISGQSVINITASQPNLGIGLNFKFPLLGLPENYYWDLGLQLNSASDGLSVSFLHLDALGLNDKDYYGNVGINYSFWNNNINGGLGCQLSAGKQLSKHSLLGVKFTFLTGSNTANGYDNNYSIRQLALEWKYSF